MFPVGIAAAFVAGFLAALLSFKIKPLPCRRCERLLHCPECGYRQPTDTHPDPTPPPQEDTSTSHNTLSGS